MSLYLLMFVFIASIPYNYKTFTCNFRTLLTNKTMIYFEIGSAFLFVIIVSKTCFRAGAVFELYRRSMSKWRHTAEFLFITCTDNKRNSCYSFRVFISNLWLSGRSAKLGSREIFRLQWNYHLGGNGLWSQFSHLHWYVCLLIITINACVCACVCMWVSDTPNCASYTTFGPPHDKTNKMTVRPAKTQISLDIRPVWSVFAVRMKKPWVLSLGP